MNSSESIPAELGVRAVSSASRMSLIGVSIGNPFFSQDNLERIITYAAGISEGGYLFIADISARHTFEALGYDSQSAKRKARLRGNALRNRCEELFRAKEEFRSRFSFVEWSAAISHPAYQEELRRLAVLYSFDDRFRAAAEESTESVIAKRESINRQQSVAIGVRFLLEELAFLLASPKIYGADRMTYLYHRPWPIFTALLNGGFDGRKYPEIDFEIFTGKQAHYDSPFSREEK